jgi:hypothetical protein
LLQDAQDPEIYPLYALLPPGRHQPPKVKVFIDFLIARLGCAPWRTGSIGPRGNRDRGQPRGCIPPTPPDVRVRIRRFDGLSGPQHRDGGKAE